MKRISPVALVATALFIVLLTGCEEEDERLAEMAREHEQHDNC